jgi:tryptophanyl-tRNA synthetase
MGVSEGIRIRDLLNPEKKMSKSTAADGSKILLSDSPERARKKIMGATTDSLGRIKFDMFAQPGISNLLQIEALISGVPLQDVISTWAGETKYGDLTPPGILVTKEMTAQDVERMRENRRKGRITSLSR